MPELLDPSEIMFTPFEPKTKNRYIMYIEGIPAYLIKTANRPTIAFEVIELDHINVKRFVKGKGSIKNIENFKKIYSEDLIKKNMKFMNQLKIFMKIKF